jgi:RimJ/RimL family protein N-acetyltransferase
MTLDLVTERLQLNYVADVETLDWLGGGRCGVYYLYSEGLYAGAVSLTSQSGTHGEIGYKIEPAFRNRGLATEALSEVIAFVHARHGFTLLTAKAHTSNSASRRVLEKNGFDRTGAKLCWSDDEQSAISMTMYHRFLSGFAR